MLQHFLRSLLLKSHFNQVLNHSGICLLLFLPPSFMSGLSLCLPISCKDRSFLSYLTKRIGLILLRSACSLQNLLEEVHEVILTISMTEGKLTFSWLWLENSSSIGHFSDKLWSYKIYSLFRKNFLLSVFSNRRSQLLFLSWALRILSTVLIGRCAWPFE